MLKLLVLFVFLSGCAQIPGNTLHREIDEPTNMDDIDITITVGFWETQKECHKGIWRDDPWKELIVIIGNLGVIPGCSIIYGENKKFLTCDIYVSWNVQWMIDHEEEHCKGYTDVLY